MLKLRGSKNHVLQTVVLFCRFLSSVHKMVCPSAGLIVQREILDDAKSAQVVTAVHGSRCPLILTPISSSIPLVLSWIWDLSQAQYGEAWRKWNENFRVITAVIFVRLTDWRMDGQSLIWSRDGASKNERDREAWFSLKFKSFKFEFGRPSQIRLVCLISHEDEVYWFS